MKLLLDVYMWPSVSTYYGVVLSFCIYTWFIFLTAIQKYG